MFLIAKCPEQFYINLMRSSNFEILIQISLEYFFVPVLCCSVWSTNTHRFRDSLSLDKVEKKTCPEIFPLVPFLFFLKKNSPPAHVPYRNLRNVY